MPIEENDFWDFLSEDEANFMREIISDMKSVSWAQPILARLSGDGNHLSKTDKDFLFELRFAYALYQAGIEPSYEVAGEGQSKIDFEFTFANQRWLVELMRLGETNAAKSATSSWTDEDGCRWASRMLDNQPPDPKSEEGETLKAVQRICQKLERDGCPNKFTIPKDAMHVLLVDFRTFLTKGGDLFDQINVAFGSEYVDQQYKRFWGGTPISGVLNQRTTVCGAPEARDRLHFIGFVTEKGYQSGGLGQATRFFANPHLLDCKDAHAAIKKWPLSYTNLMTAQV